MDGGTIGEPITVQTPQKRTTAILLVAALLLQGCALEKPRLQYLWPNNGPLSYYEDSASAIVYPVETDTRSVNPQLLQAPRHIRSLDDVEPREISLTECIHLALAEAAILRDNSVARGGQNEILQRPSGVSSIYDPAIQSTGFLFGNRG